MKRIMFVLPLLLLSHWLVAQDKTHTITADEYEKAKTLKVKDLDNDTYLKFENTYVLDRYENRKPYFITGDDGNKKRIDLYRFLLKDGMQELGTVVIYTNEKGKAYQACLPDFKSDPKIWGRYFEDIHAIDREEPNFVLKLSYVLSKEFGFQLYKAANQGRDVSKEAGTYGSNICFPGNTEVTMWNGSKKILKDIKRGDRIITVDPDTHIPSVTAVQSLVTHEEKNYAITRLVLLAVQEQKNARYTETVLSVKELKATPNHPVMTVLGEKKAGELLEGDEILCKDPVTGAYNRFVVWTRQEQAEGNQKVYNIIAGSGKTFVMNDVMVLQKPGKGGQ